MYENQTYEMLGGADAGGNTGYIVAICGVCILRSTSTSMKWF